MSLRLETLQVCRLAPKLLGEAADLVRGFVADRLREDGSFADRQGSADLYYTVFGLDCLCALDTAVPTARVTPYLESFGGGEGLDLVHLSCLARAWAAVGTTPSRGAEMARRVGDFRSADGGFASSPGAEQGSVYDCFLAVSALEDLGAEIPDRDSLAASVLRYATPTGGFANDLRLDAGTTPVTAAAVVLLPHLGRPAPGSAGSWLLGQRHRQGGFLAAPGAPMPDLLSTATALHALAALDRPLQDLAEPCLDFLDSLWTNRGAFHGSWADDDLDVEYTFYGLLALGHLSLWSR